MKPSLTIAIPLYNEEEGVENLYNQLNVEIENIKNKVDLKVLLVDDGSTDSTLHLLKKYFYSEEYEIINHKINLNLGGFYKTAINNCKSEYIGFLDSDCTYSPKLINEMLDFIFKGYEIINASPWHPDGQVDGLSKFRILLSKSANLIYRIILRKKIYTSSSICKIYKYECIENIEITNRGYVSVTELFTKSLLKNYKFYEYPCLLTVRKFGTSKINFSSTVIEHFKYMFKLLNLKYNLK
tara:strand:- start:153 stop:872 length:720 start_codon:yes stop_codon:yes gene_type:complete